MSSDAHTQIALHALTDAALKIINDNKIGSPEEKVILHKLGELIDLSDSEGQFFIVNETKHAPIVLLYLNSLKQREMMDLESSPKHFDDDSFLYANIIDMVMDRRISNTDFCKNILNKAYGAAIDRSYNLFHQNSVCRAIDGIFEYEDPIDSNKMDILFHLSNFNDQARDLLYQAVFHVSTNDSNLNIGEITTLLDNLKKDSGLYSGFANYLNKKADDLSDGKFKYKIQELRYFVPASFSGHAWIKDIIPALYDGIAEDFSGHNPEQKDLKLKLFIMKHNGGSGRDNLIFKHLLEDIKSMSQDLLERSLTEESFYHMTEMGYIDPSLIDPSKTKLPFLKKAKLVDDLGL